MSRSIKESAARHPTRALLIPAVVTVNALVFGLLLAAGVPLFGGTKQQTVTDRTDITLIPLANSVDTPASMIVTKLLDGSVAGAKPAGPRWASSGLPFDRACPSGGGVSPVVAWSRPYNGSGRTVSVQVSAYGAGQGAAGVAQMVERLRGCSGSTSYGTSFGDDSTAVIATSRSDVSDATALVWKRSDVVVSVTAQGAGTGGLAAIAAGVDARLLSLLTPACASLKVSVADAGRSPWSGQSYTGNLEPHSVPLEYPDPSTSPTPALPSSVPLVSVPGPTLAVPSLAPVPTDADLAAVPPTPVLASPLSSELPSVPVTSAPSAPVAPSPAPSDQVVKLQVADPIGPGCGWAFTLQGAPTFDGDAAVAQYDADIAAAKDSLRAADAAWQIARASYSTSYAEYVSQVQAFVQYANANNQYVAGLKSTKYERDLAAYQAAVAARDVFLDNQQFARVEYENAVHACADAGSPTPTASPTATDDPGIPTDVATDEPTPGVDAPCPPEEPAILTELPPMVPKKPKPPT